jgi:hypothetical protein
MQRGEIIAVRWYAQLEAKAHEGADKTHGMKRRKICGVGLLELRTVQRKLGQGLEFAEFLARHLPLPCPLTIASSTTPKSNRVAPR